jgi:hypothetical protein
MAKVKQLEQQIDEMDNCLQVPPALYWQWQRMFGEALDIGFELGCAMYEAERSNYDPAVTWDDVMVEGMIAGAV